MLSTGNLEIDVRFSGVLSKQQFYRFQQVCTPLFLRRLLKWFPWLWLGFMLVRATGIAGYFTSRMLVFDILGLAYFMAVLPLMRQWQQRRAWKNSQLIKAAVFGVANPTELIWETAYVRLRLPWDMVLKARLTKDLVLVYTSLCQALVLPRSFFSSEDDWQSFRQLVAENSSVIK